MYLFSFIFLTFLVFIYDAIPVSGGYMSSIHPRTCIFAWNVYKYDFSLAWRFIGKGVND